MGTWGASLYDEDEAGDLKNAIAVVCKVPGDGDRLLSLLKEMYGARDPASDESLLFWLVVADQFERRGFRCAEATANALAIIRSGADLARASAHGADAAFIRKRTRVLEELGRRLSAPRPQRAGQSSGKAPELVLEQGEVYAFPTMKGNAWHPYRLPSAGVFTPDRWGAMVVLATGRAFEWLPWVALASLTVPPEQKPNLEAALAAHLIARPETEGARPVRAEAGAPARPRRGAYRARSPRSGSRGASPLSVADSKAIQHDWTIAYAAIAPTATGIEVGCALSSLIASLKPSR